MVKKKIDVFNFFYSIGAVVILIGVIAKFLEWQLQDVFLLTGLSVEAMVFTMSSIQYKETEKKEYKWEKLFPELVDNPEQPSNLTAIQENIENLSKRYLKGITTYIEKFESLNSSIVDGNHQYKETVDLMSTHLSQSVIAFKEFNESTTKVNAAFVELYDIGEDIKKLQENIQSLSSISFLSGDKLHHFQEQLDSLNNAIFRFNALSTGIMKQFKQIGN